LIRADGRDGQSLTRNDWEWDKYPSWSPDSMQIVFWSNRTGIQQIYVIDADGKNLHNISNTGWGEYDPIWIK
jgi:TolB protein